MLLPYHLGALDTILWELRHSNYFYATTEYRCGSLVHCVVSRPGSRLQCAVFIPKEHEIIVHTWKYAMHLNDLIRFLQRGWQEISSESLLNIGASHWVGLHGGRQPVGCRSVSTAAHVIEGLYLRRDASSLRSRTWPFATRRKVVRAIVRREGESHRSLRQGRRRGAVRSRNTELLFASDAARRQRVAVAFVIITDNKVETSTSFHSHSLPRAHTLVTRCSCLWFCPIRIARPPHRCPSGTPRQLPRTWNVRAKQVAARGGCLWCRPTHHAHLHHRNQIGKLRRPPTAGPTICSTTTTH